MFHVSGIQAKTPIFMREKPSHKQITVWPYQKCSKGGMYIALQVERLEGKPEVTGKVAPSECKVGCWTQIPHQEWEERHFWERQEWDVVV